MLQAPLARPVSKRKQRAGFLRRVSKVQITAGTKHAFVVVVPLAADRTVAASKSSLLVLNRTADAIAHLQSALAQACCTRATCRVCSHFSNLPRLPVGACDRLLLSAPQIREVFEARLARLVQTAAALTATESREAKCVAQMQAIVSRFFLHGLSQPPP